MKKGIFITMEGPDGSGKTTQIELLKDYLEKAGYDVLITREPGGTVISEAIREIILNKDYTEMSPVTEMLLYASARAQLINEVIGPALDSGKAVISDRKVPDLNALSDVLEINAKMREIDPFIHIRR